MRVERKGRLESYAAGTSCPDPTAPPDTPCTVETTFDLASLTKLATTALLLSLVRDRALSLETPLHELVPDFRGGRKTEVTLAHVLTHTAGLKWWLPLWQEARTIEEAVWRAAQEPLAQDLGTFTYSDLGYVMLTAGLATAGGAPFDALVAERVTGPVEARTIRYRRLFGWSRAMCARSVTFGRAPSPSSTAAASMPSADVPDMIPIAIMTPRPRGRRCGTGTSRRRSRGRSRRGS